MQVLADLQTPFRAAHFVCRAAQSWQSFHWHFAQASGHFPRVPGVSFCSAHETGALQVYYLLSASRIESDDILDRHQNCGLKRTVSIK